jgi:peptidoglycan hydrolase CwlO-like protein
MSSKLNKKQKKQIDIARKKLSKLHQLVGAARKQPDDPAEVPRLEAEIAALEQQIEKIQSDG